MDPVEALKAIRSEMEPSKQALKKGGEVFADSVVEMLGVSRDEVAILLLTTTQRTLRFIWPNALCDSSAVFPVDHKAAFASSVISTMKGKVDNKLSESKHLRFFESIKGMDTSGTPIQKMMALPLIAGKRAFGVIEVSRKGKTPTSAGPDFTQEDAKKLVALCKNLAPGLVSLIPDPFL